MAITANRYLTLFLLLAAAGISYAIGFIVGFWLFIVVGVILEIAFWMKLLSDNRRRAQVRNLDESRLSELESWGCACGERNPKSFDVCWSCGSRHDG